MHQDSGADLDIEKLQGHSGILQEPTETPQGAGLAPADISTTHKPTPFL